MEPKWRVFIGCVAACGLFIAIVLYREHIAWSSLTSEQQTQVTQLTSRLNELQPGDFVSMKRPEAYVREDGVIVYRPYGETYTVKSVDRAQCTALLSGPGPFSVSYGAPGRVIAWAGALSAVELIDSVTFVHHQGDDGWQDMATWYYLE